GTTSSVYSNTRGLVTSRTRPYRKPRMKGKLASLEEPKADGNPNELAIQNPNSFLWSSGCGSGARPIGAVPTGAALVGAARVAGGGAVIDGNEVLAVV